MQHERGGRLAVATAGDEWDPVAGVAVLLGRKWHAVVLHRLFAHGPLGFNDLAGAIEGISNKVLSDCLGDLEPVIAAMEEWGETMVERAATRDEAVASVPR